jgi:asparagine synthase (glutamine-hydrolysing)
MSGIVGVVDLEGAQIVPQLLRLMTDSLAFRGPDNQAIWIDGAVGLGHALLRTTDRSSREQQPLTLDGTAWVTADARLDGRADLIRQLEANGRSGVDSANDAQLILHAYQSWGPACVGHLLGDFAFAIWDTRTRRLFCARDRFGVKPFYYARAGGGLVFSNTLECVRQYPGVDCALNETAIADFLLFGFNQDPTTTTFAAIRRLCPAHTLICENGEVHVTRYWSLPADGRIRYRRPGDYVDHFVQILEDAVGDRLRTDRVAVWMSGGLDSTSIAAIARRLLPKARDGFELRAHTIVYDSLIPDNEREYAQVAGEALNVPASYFVADSYRPFDGWNRLSPFPPEPADDPFLCLRTDHLKHVATHSRVLLCGEGGDEVFASSYVADLASRMAILELGRDVARSLLRYRRRPGAGLRAKLKKALRLYTSETTTCPPWLNAAFVERMNLRARCKEVNQAPRTGQALRSEAHRRLDSAPWSWYFEWADPGATRVAVECRYPFMDVRLVEYLLAIPPLPWFIDKLLLREAMRGTLPDRVRLRPKAALGGDPLAAHLRRQGLTLRQHFDPAPELLGWVDAAAILSLNGSERDPWRDLRPICLNYWLRNVQRQEVPDGRAFAAVKHR